MINADNLITKEKYVLNGCRWQANKKSLMANDILKFTQKAKKELRKVNSFHEILESELMSEFIIGASMLSRKSTNHFSATELISFLAKVIDFERLNELNYLNELERYYLLTAGDSVGGKMRNLVGNKGNDLLIEHITTYLNEHNVDYKLIVSKNNNVQSIETDLSAIIFNKKPKFINKSIDFIVVKKEKDQKYDLEDYDSYIAAGELKSGIDPAGADEHWKTATTALARIRNVFNNLEKPIPLYFIGGAISKHMATEIIDAIENKELKLAANLNIKKQMDFLIRDMFKGLFIDK